MADERDRRRRSYPDLVPALVLAAVLLAGLAGWWLFPLALHALSYQDCIASGHVNCGR